LTEQNSSHGDNQPFKSMGQILQSLMGKRSALRRKLKKREIFSRWRDIAGDQLHDKLFPLRIRGKVLFVAAISSSWAQEASFFRDRLIDNISREIGNVVEEIRIEVRASSNVVSEIERKRPEELSRNHSKHPDPQIDISQESPDNEADVGEMLGRLRRVDEKMKQWRRQQGWPVCRQCGLSFTPQLRKGETHDICPICRRHKHKEKITDVRELVNEAPWMTPEKLMSETGASFEICQQMRAEMEMFLRCRIIECVGQATAQGEVPRDFRRNVMQLIMLVKSRSDPSLTYEEVETHCGTAAADIFF